MKVTEIKCDKCFKLGAKSYQSLLGKELDASGNGYENIWADVDLCLQCLIDYARLHPKAKISEKL